MKATHLFFALTMVLIGVIGLVSGGFAPIWAGVPKSLPDRQLLAYLCTFISLACGAGLLMKRTAGPAALTLLVYLTIWTVLFKIPIIVRQPLVEVSYQTCGENAVLIAAAGCLYAGLASGGSGRRMNFLMGDTGLRMAHLLYGLALIAFGFSHFAYLNLTAPLVPAWLPVHIFWAYFTGSIYLITGLAIAIGVAARLAAAVSAFQIGLITLLVWGPGLLSGHVTTDAWEETVISWALTAGAFVVSTSYNRYPLLKRLGYGALITRRLARG
jgi:uncharacterized membrane protein